MRVGTIDIPPGTLQLVDLNGPLAAELLPQVNALEAEQYGRKDGREPLLQYPPDILEATLGHARSVGVGLRDRVSGRLVAYAIGSPLENHDELGVREDPSFGDNDTLYLQAMAVSPQLKNQAEVEGMILDAFRARAEWAGFAALSSLIEARVVERRAGLDPVGRRARDRRRLPAVRRLVRLPAGAHRRGRGGLTDGEPRRRRADPPRRRMGPRALAQPARDPEPGHRRRSWAWSPTATRRTSTAP